MKNKYEEALNYFLDREEGENITVTCDWSIYAEELKELVDKETPMKPNGIKCGKCGSWVVEDTRMGTTHFHRCRNIECEQKIDWSDNNDY